MDSTNVKQLPGIAVVVLNSFVYSSRLQAQHRFLVSVLLRSPSLLAVPARSIGARIARATTRHHPKPAYRQPPTFTYLPARVRVTTLPRTCQHTLPPHARTTCARTRAAPAHHTSAPTALPATLPTAGTRVTCLPFHLYLCHTIFYHTHLYLFTTLPLTHAVTRAAPALPLFADVECLRSTAFWY